MKITEPVGIPGPEIVGLGFKKLGETVRGIEEPEVGGPVETVSGVKDLASWLLPIF